MKSSLLRSIASAVLAGSFAVSGCSTDMAGADAQAKVDSIVAAKMGSLKAQMRKHNDSLIQAMAVARADSMMQSNTAAAPAGK